MKEASGELSMTLIVIIAAGVIIGIFAIFWPQISEKLTSMWGNFETDAGDPKTQKSNSGGTVNYIIPGYTITLK